MESETWNCVAALTGGHASSGPCRLYYARRGGRRAADAYTSERQASEARVILISERRLHNGARPARHDDPRMLAGRHRGTRHCWVIQPQEQREK